MGKKTLNVVSRHTLKEGLRKQIKNLAEAASKEQGVCTDDLLFALGPRGHALFGLVLALPFLLPVPLPGLSTPFGFIVFFVGMGILLNKPPWLPKRLRRMKVPGRVLIQIDEKAGPKLERLEKFLRPRWFDFESGSPVSRVHGLLISFGAVLLALPAPPGGNAPPAGAIIFFCVALLERDGLMTVLGVIALGISLTFFGSLAVLIATFTV